MSKVFQLDAPKATDNFKFRMPGSKTTHELPSLQKLPLGIRKEMGELAGVVQAQQEKGKQPTQAQANKLLEFQLNLLEHYVPGITKQLDDDMFMALMQAWKEHSDISMGE